MAVIRSSVGQCRVHESHETAGDAGERHTQGDDTEAGDGDVREVLESEADRGGDEPRKRAASKPRYTPTRTLESGSGAIERASDPVRKWMVISYQSTASTALPSRSSGRPSSCSTISASARRVSRNSTPSPPRRCRGSARRARISSGASRPSLNERGEPVRGSCLITKSVGREREVRELLPAHTTPVRAPASVSWPRSPRRRSLSDPRRGDPAAEYTLYSATVVSAGDSGIGT